MDEGHLIFISIHWFSCITIESKSYSAEKKKKKTVNAKALTSNKSMPHGWEQKQK